MSQNTPAPAHSPKDVAAEHTPAEKIILEISLADLPPQTQRDLKAHSTLERSTTSEHLANLLTKKFGGVFTFRAA